MLAYLVAILCLCVATVAWEHRPSAERPKTWSWLDDEADR